MKGASEPLPSDFHYIVPTKVDNKLFINFQVYYKQKLYSVDNRTRNEKELVCEKKPKSKIVRQSTAVLGSRV